MPRKPRKFITSQNTLYHIVCRGNNKKRIFRRYRDYQKFLTIIAETKKKFPFYFYSYSFLPNHFHLEIETRETPISKVMHQINSSYAKYFHRQYQTVGHLFQDRFYSSVIDKESYFWEVGRYIDLNAARARLIDNPEDYKWSSYSIYCQKDYDGDLIDSERFLKFVDEDLGKARIDYLKFVEEGLKKEETPRFPLNDKMF